jgi:hypothetical protein
MFIHALNLRQRTAVRTAPEEAEYSHCSDHTETKEKSPVVLSDDRPNGVNAVRWSCGA